MKSDIKDFFQKLAYINEIHTYIDSSGYLKHGIKHMASDKSIVPPE